MPRSPIFWSHAVAQEWIPHDKAAELQQSMDRLERVLWQHRPWLHPAGQAGSLPGQSRTCMMCQASISPLSIVDDGKDVQWWPGFIDQGGNYQHLCISCGEELNILLPVRLSNPPTLLLRDSPPCKSCGLLPEGFLIEKDSLNDKDGMVCAFCGDVRRP